jgi:hypothetical protein
VESEVESIKDMLEASSSVGWSFVDIVDVGTVRLVCVDSVDEVVGV